MFQGVYKLGLAAMILAACVIGCGEGNLLDESELYYTGTLAVLELGEETVQVDVYQINDCDGDATTSDPEPYSDTLGEISVTVDENTWGLTLEYYTISYVPLYSPDANGDNQLPPDLTDPASPGDSNFSVASGSTSTMTITLLSTDSKAEYLTKLAADASLSALSVARYRINVTLYFTDEYGNDRTLSLNRTVYLGFYDLCEE